MAHIALLFVQQMGNITVYMYVTQLINILLLICTFKLDKRCLCSLYTIQTTNMCMNYL